MNKSLIGKRLRGQRGALNLTREQFAEKVGISSQFLTEIKNGTKGMSAETLCKICVQGGAFADYILFGIIGADSQLPTVKILNDIPTKYSVVLEDIIRTFKNTIEISNDEKNR